MLLDTGVAPALIKIAKSEDLDTAMIIPLIGALGNCVKWSDDQTQVLVEAGVIEAVEGFLDHAYVSDWCPSHRVALLMQSTTLIRFLLCFLSTEYYTKADVLASVKYCGWNPRADVIAHEAKTVGESCPNVVP